jgi:hypothetical protein
MPVGMSPSMNAVTDFFVRHITAVFFFYGLAFFVMGMALLFVGPRTSQLRFALALVPLATLPTIHIMASGTPKRSAANVANGAVITAISVRPIIPLLCGQAAVQ